MYNILIKYITGNSFGTHETSDLLEIPFSNIETGKENLRRIREHYKAYQEKTSYGNLTNVNFPKFYINHRKGVGFGKNSLNGIILLLDDGTEHEMLSCFWIGYFEHLISAEIVLDDPNSELKIEV